MCFATSGCSCVRSSMRFLNLWLHDRIGMAAWMLHGFLGQEATARNLVFFRVKCLHVAKKGTSSVRRVRLGSFHARIVPPMCFATIGCSCVRSSMRFLKLLLQIALEWLHECCMGYILGRKPEHETVCFPCKVSACGEERYLVCAAGAAEFVSLFVLCVLQRVVVPVCVVLCGSWISGCMIALEWLHECYMGYVLGGRWSTKPCLFRVKWLQPAMKGASSVRLVRLGSFHARIVPPMCFPTSGCSCVRSSMGF